MSVQESNDASIYSTEGPTYKDGIWVSRITLKERESETFQGETREEVQEKVLQYLGQQALEIEKLRVLLRKRFEEQSMDAKNE